MNRFPLGHKTGPFGKPPPPIAIQPSKALAPIPPPPTNQIVDSDFEEDDINESYETLPLSVLLKLALKISKNAKE